MENNTGVNNPEWNPKDNTIINSESDAVDVRTGEEWVNVDNMKQLIENMKSKNFYPEIIIEEIEKHLSDPTLLNKLFSVRKSHSPVPVKEGEQEDAVKFAEWICANGFFTMPVLKKWNEGLFGKEYTTQELYNQFKQSTTKP